MTPELHNKPRIPQSWLRIFLFCTAYFGLLLLATAIPGVLVHTGTKAVAETATTGVPYLFFIISAVIAVVVVWVFCRFADRRSFESVGFAIDKNGAHAGAGFFMGTLLLCAGTCILFFSKHLVWTDLSFNGTDLFISFGLMVIIAFSEEIVFRGYILHNLMSTANKWVALLISAFIFAMGHLANPDFSVVGAINIFLAGLLLGINYVYTKNLWFGIMLHFAWNFLQGPVFGYEVSGTPLQSFLQHDISGNPLLTGGKFGFEGSLVATLLCIMAIGGLVWVYEKKYTSWPTEDTITDPAVA